MRLFLGIYLPRKTQQQVARYTSELKHSLGSSATWVQAANLHLTVGFFGEVQADKVKPLTESLRRAVARLAKFTLDLGNPILIPSRQPRIVALEVAASPDFRELQRTCTAAARQHGITTSAKDAHLTLARFKGTLHNLPRGNQALPPTRLPVEKLALIKSTLTPDGPHYHTLATFKLMAGVPAARYRPNVAICVINPKHEVLLVWHREHIKRYWQFLQGGIAPGETITQAVRRELKEELGIGRFDIVTIRERVYRYRWPAHLIAQGTDPDKQGYIGQEQSLAIVRLPEARPTLRPDAREAAATKWFPASGFLKAINPIRRTVGKLAVVELQKLGPHTP